MDTPTVARDERPLTRSERVKLDLHRWLDRHLSPLGVWAMRRTKGALAGPFKVKALLLTTRGRRSGHERTVVLQYFPDGAAMVIVAANDGGDAYPGWYHNLTATPEAVAEIDGRRISVHAAELEPDEVARWWERILVASPDYERYRRATTRRFPIIRLTPS